MRDTKKIPFTSDASSIFSSSNKIGSKSSRRDREFLFKSSLLLSKFPWNAVLADFIYLKIEENLLSCIIQ